jgi:hypothetical protein
VVSHGRPREQSPAALALVTQTHDLASPIRGADELAAAFLAGYGPATREAYARDLRAWGEYLAGLDVEVLAAHRVHVDAFVRHGEDGDVAPATIARRLSALSGFYAYALDEGLIARSPVARVRRPRVSDESPRLGVDRAGMRALLDTAKASRPRDRALACLLALNGLRVSETLAADVAALAHKRGHHRARLTEDCSQERCGLGAGDARQSRVCAIPTPQRGTAGVVGNPLTRHAHGETKRSFWPARRGQLGRRLPRSLGSHRAR